MPGKKSSKACPVDAPMHSGQRGQQRWSDQYPMEPRRTERRFAQRIAGDAGSMDKPVTRPKGG
jgi:hypothetical protein